MKAMIFAAGLGTRFKPWTDTHPKALAIVGGKSLLQRNIEYLQQYSIYEVVVNVHHFADELIYTIEQHKGWGSTVVISDEREAVLETGGGLLKARSLLGNESFITINADILTNLNLHHFIAYHRQQQALITLAITNRVTSRYLLFNEENRLCGWRNIKTGAEKIVIPKTGLVPQAYSGIALFDAAVLDHIPFTGKFSVIDIYLALAPHYKIVGYDHSGDLFIDVGTPESAAAANVLFSSK